MDVEVLQFGRLCHFLEKREPVEVTMIGNKHRVVQAMRETAQPGTAQQRLQP